MNLGKLQLYAKFEVAGFIYYGNIKLFVFERQIRIFSQRIINVWNNLPSDIVDFSTLCSFKKTLLALVILFMLFYIMCCVCLDVCMYGQLLVLVIQP